MTHGAHGDKHSRTGTFFADTASRLLERGYSTRAGGPVGQGSSGEGWQNYGGRQPSLAVVERWSKQVAGHNVGGACGRLVALDIDAESSEEAFNLQQRAFRDFGETRRLLVPKAALDRMLNGSEAA